MKTADELKRYFETDLQPTVKALEAARLKMLSQISFKFYRRGLLVLIPLAIAGMTLNATMPESPLHFLFLFAPFTALFALVYPIYIWIKRSNAFSKVALVSKQTVMQKLLTAIDPAIQYEPEAVLPFSEIEASRLFPDFKMRGDNKYRNHDRVSVVVGQATAQMTFVQLIEARQEASDYSEERSRTLTTTVAYTIFQGLFIKADIKQPNLPDELAMKMKSLAERTDQKLQILSVGNSIYLALSTPNPFAWDYNTSMNDFAKFNGFVGQVLLALQILNMLKQD